MSDENSKNEIKKSLGLIKFCWDMIVTLTKKILKQFWEFIKSHWKWIIPVIISLLVFIIAKSSLEYNKSLQRARLEIDLKFSPPKIQTSQNEGAYEITIWYPIKNKGKTTARFLFYEVSVKFETPDYQSAELKYKGPEFILPVLYEPGQEGYCTVPVRGDKIKMEQLIKNIEENKFHIVSNIKIRYSDEITKREYSTSSLKIRFNKEKLEYLEVPLVHNKF